MKNILFIQHGDYGEAHARFAQGGDETYRDQRRSVAYVAGLAGPWNVTTLAICNRPHDTGLAPSLRSIGIPRTELTAARIRRQLDEVHPDVTVMRTPNLTVVREVMRRDGHVLPCFADTFRTGGPRGRLANFRLRRALSSRPLPCIANHSLNASRSMIACLGLPPDRIVPWDWSRLPAHPGIKSAPAGPGPFSVLYAGGLDPGRGIEKGAGDCLAAIAECRTLGLPVRISMAGAGDPGFWRDRAARLGVADAVEILGEVPNDRVRQLMQVHDAVVVPSRHSYPEGLPNTIYEGLASRSPLLISDHPAFRGRLRDGSQCLVFEAANPGALARALFRLARDPPLYATLSAGSEAALAGLYVGLEWSALIGQFLDDPENRTGWVARNALSALGDRPA